MMHAMNVSMAALIVVGLLIVALCAFCYRLLLDRGQLLLRLETQEGSKTSAARLPTGLPAGSYLADFALPRFPGEEQTGDLVALSSLVGPPLLLVFLRADCLFSRAFARELARQARRPEAPLPITIVIGGRDDGDSVFATMPGVVLRDPHGQLARFLRVTDTPSGYRVDGARHTVGPILAGPLALLAAARDEDTSEPQAAPLALSPLPARAASRLTPLRPGNAAPDFTLPSLTGGAWRLSAQRGTPLLLLFCDPDCPPCVDLLAALDGQELPDLVIVSRGAAAQHARCAVAVGSATPILLQRFREVARMYGTLETPAAYLIDADGWITDGPAIGVDAVLALNTRRSSRTIRNTSAETRPA